MNRKYSRKLIHNAVEFLRAANEELEDGLGEEQVYAMLDAFDPALKRQLMMEMLMGQTGSVIRIQSTRSEMRQKIEAIKYVRSATGLGLKEAKEVIDTADYGVGEISGDWGHDAVNALARNLQSTGYKVL